MSGPIILGSIFGIIIGLCAWANLGIRPPFHKDRRDPPGMAKKIREGEGL
jgi:hypothetical protein